MTRCKSCNQPISFVRTPAGKLMPVDIDRVTVVTANGRVVTGQPPHWATCPNASQHRKPRRDK